MDLYEIKGSRSNRNMYDRGGTVYRPGVCVWSGEGGGCAEVSHSGAGGGRGTDRIHQGSSVDAGRGGGIAGIGEDGGRI